MQRFTLLILLYLVSICFTASYPGCGFWGPAQWFNSTINDQLTLQYGAPILALENAIPFLFGCTPEIAQSSSVNASFKYNEQKLVSNWNLSTTESYNASYSTHPSGEYSLFTVYLESDTKTMITTRYDTENRIVTIAMDQEVSLNDIISAPFLPSSFMTPHPISSRRAIQIPVSNINYHYNNVSRYASSIDVELHGVIQVNQQFDYGIFNNKLIYMNVSYALLNDPPFFVFYQYYYDQQQQQLMSYYCVNGCGNIKIVFSYDDKGRFTGATSNQDITMQVKYEGDDAVDVEFDNRQWVLKYA